MLFLGWTAWQAGASMWLPTSVRFENVTIAARVARTDQARERGLSNTESLADGTGMLFVFDTEDRWGMWMRDMKYPIDIIWLNAQKEVVHIVHRAEPASYPKTKFQPSKPAKYVLEIPAGAAREYAIRVGDTAGFKT